MNDNYSVVVRRINTGELIVKVVPGTVSRDEFTRVKSGVTEEKAKQLQAQLSEDFEKHGELWQMYENGSAAIPDNYTKQLAQYIANPENPPDYITVCQTPEMLESLGITTPDIRITPRVIKKCMEKHNLDFDTLKQLPSQLRDPAMIMKSLTVPGSLVTVTTLKDKENRPVIVSLANNNRGGVEICAISSAYGRTGFQNWIQKNIENKSVLYENKERIGTMYTPEHLSPGAKTPEHGGSVTINPDSDKNSIPQSKPEVNTESKKISRKTLASGDVLMGTVQYGEIANKRFIKTDHETALKTADRLAQSGLAFSAKFRADGSATLTVGASDYAAAFAVARGISPSLKDSYNKEKMSFNEILRRFEKVEHVKGTQHRANCPCCGDTKQHLYIKLDESNGKILLECKRKCSAWEVASAVGLEMSDLFTEQSEFVPQNAAQSRVQKPTVPAPTPPPEKPAPIPAPEKSEKPEKSPIKYWRNYDYTAPDGKKLYQKGVAHRENGDKFAVWKRYDDSGRLVNDRKGLDGAKPPLFHQHNLNADKIYIVEGEKDVMTMERLGLAAVCSPHGSNWCAAHAPQFAGKEVVVITDNDDPGRKYGADIERSLQGVAKSVTVIPAAEIHPVKHKGDITDIADMCGLQSAKLLLAERERSPPPEIDLEEIDLVQGVQEEAEQSEFATEIDSREECELCSGGD